MPPPGRWGLPPHFEEWRPEQNDALYNSFESAYRFDGHRLLTGSGKTGVYMGIAGAWKTKRILILTATKGLQDQIVRDFVSMGVVDLKGQSNYPCVGHLPGGPMEGLISVDEFEEQERLGTYLTYDDAPCQHGVECAIKHLCPYPTREGEAARARIVLMNYAKWFRVTTDEEGYSKKVGSFDVLVCDEAHNTPEELSRALAMEVKRKDVVAATRAEDWPYPEPKTADGWREWARWYDGILGKTIEGVKLGAAQSVAWKYKRLGALTRLKRTIASLAGIAGHWAIDLLIDSRKHVYGVNCEPLWPGPYAESWLFRRIPKVLFFSATLHPKHLNLLGLKSEQFAFWDYPSSFPVPRRPIIWVKTARLNYKTEQDEAVQKVLVDRIDEAMDARSDRKGLLFVGSYKRLDMIVQRSSFPKRLVWHRDASGRDEAIRRFNASKPEEGLVLASPAITTGYDFPGEKAEYGMLAKVPFPVAQTTIMRARIAEDKQYADHITSVELQQLCGRGMRGRLDRFEMLIFDDLFWWFVWSHRTLFSPSFLAAVRKSPREGVLPKPLQKLPPDVEKGWEEGSDEQ